MNPTLLSPEEAAKVDHYEIYRQQVYLAKDGWPKHFIEIGTGSGLDLFTRMISDSGRNIKLTHVPVEDAVQYASGVGNGEVNLVFLDDVPIEILGGTLIAWWPKIRVSGWIGGSDIRDEAVKKIVTEIFRTQYPQSDPMIRVLQIGHGWLVPKFHEPINYPWKGQAYFG